MNYTTLNEILLHLLGSKELVERWWATPNKAFDGQIPDDMLHSSDRNLVVRYIMSQLGPGGS